MTWLKRNDYGLPYQTWCPFNKNDIVEVKNMYGETKIGPAHSFWWGYENTIGVISEGTIIEARLIPQPKPAPFSIWVDHEPKGSENAKIVYGETDGHEHYVNLNQLKQQLKKYYIFTDDRDNTVVTENGNGTLHIGDDYDYAVDMVIDKIVKEHM